MKRAVFAAPIALFLGVGRAGAHGALQGVGDFYGGLLHPLLVPAELLLLVATGLILGSSGREACRKALPTFGLGVAAGLAVGSRVPDGILTPALLAIALLCGALVAAALRVSPAIGAAAAVLVGLAVGMDARPEAEAPRPFFVASAGTVIAAMALLTVVMALVVERSHLWQHVAVRTVGSWIAACSILYFAWVFATR